MTNDIRRAMRMASNDADDATNSASRSVSFAMDSGLASSMVISGTRWAALSHLIAVVFLAGWLAQPQFAANSGEWLPRTALCIALILALDVPILLPWTSRKLARLEGRLPLVLNSLAGFASAALWMVLATGFDVSQWEVVVVALVSAGLGILCVSQAPYLVVARIAGAHSAYLITGIGFEVKTVSTLIAFVMVGMIVAQARRLDRMQATASAIAMKAINAERMMASFERSGRGWFWETDQNGLVTYMSASQGALFNSEDGTVIGRPLSSLVQADDKSNAVPASADRSFAYLLSAGVDFDEIVVRAACEEEQWWSLAGVALHDGKGRCIGFHGSGVDLTEKRKAEAEARQFARFDSLTGLANRATIRKSLDDVMNPSNAAKPDCGLMLLDLDRFKAVNDSLGHPVGDQLLMIVAKRLLRIVGDTCQVGRLGGDEFQVVIPDVGERSELARLAGAIIDRLSLPYEIEGTTIRIGASVGIAIAPVDGVDADELTRNADLALYAAKEGGRGIHCFYQPDMQSTANERRALENDLREIFARGELQVVFQPVVDGVSEAVVGYEALARWMHPVRGDVPPSVFIPIAEEIGLVSRIGEWVFREACREAMKWPEHLRVAVNLSPKQFESETLVSSLDAILRETGLAAERLELEITEGLLLQEGGSAQAKLDQIQSLGVRLVLDDFGTGYASLGYLKRVAFSKIKIDQSFVRGAGDVSSRSSAIIRAIISLAESLGMETVAEGVETLDEIELIRSLGCSQMQGYIFGVPKDRLETLEQALDSKPLVPHGADAEIGNRDNRISLLRVARIHSGDTSTTGKIRNVSRKGALIELAGDVAIRPDVMIELPGGAQFRGQVRWRKGKQVGLHFAEPIDVQLIVGKPGLMPAHAVGVEEQGPSKAEAA